MKKLVLTTICTLAVAGAAFAQGTVNWGAAVPTGFTAETNATVYSPLLGGGSAVGGTIGLTATPALGFYYELLYTTYSGTQAAVPATLSALESWSDAGLEMTNVTASTGKAAGYPNNTEATVPWAPGITDSIVLVGWSANLGTSYSTVLTELEQWTTGADYSQSISGPAYFGVSATGYQSLGSANPGTTIIGTANNTVGKQLDSPNTQLYLLPVAPVPEPTTLALATLGGASLLLFRRRK
jgi:hypothetical protein